MSHKGSFTLAKFIDENISDIAMPPSLLGLAK
jgi:hypothetical protein